MGDRRRPGRARDRRPHPRQGGTYNGDFNYAGVEVGFPSPGLGPLGPIFIQRIKFRDRGLAEEERGVPDLGVEDVGCPAVHAEGRLRRADVRALRRGRAHRRPAILGAAAISLDAGLGLATYDDRPSVMRAFGDLKVIGIPFAKATFEADSDGS